MSQPIEMSRMMLEMRSMQAEAQSRIQPAMPSLSELGSAREVNKVPDFAELFKTAIDSVNGQQQTANQMRTAFERGDAGVDLPDVMIAAQKASISFQAMSEVRNKLVNAYEEIMKMPV
ncbi:flagellar hook-basal body complex protein FliE [Aestuariirhabdus litorea]|uniref:Flagellar hook-basal body complex protein FliE n=1 Tax=Aestuariirhabdus litorea TaxID=2528527 RepID=A0A3P3VQJ3_9GAMM|nr:flagellar hook-basal body complex protein FliE [Aestuariirhabdus litorea]RRJ84995.1 flagellar hook-basal body complex protein FliE [Aestuariirhabdus litorea]RWW98220.1 flagellar hook-basal body complex protein FliE [Endozoicomonadaceae bacterium GTF-13]